MSTSSTHTRTRAGQTEPVNEHSGETHITNVDDAVRQRRRPKSQGPDAPAVTQPVSDEAAESLREMDNPSAGNTSADAGPDQPQQRPVSDNKAGG